MNAIYHNSNTEYLNEFKKSNTFQVCVLNEFNFLIDLNFWKFY